MALLSKKETTLSFVGGALALVILGGGFFVTDSQNSEITKLKLKEKNAVTATELAKRKVEIARAKKLKVEIAKSEGLQGRLEKFIPPGQEQAISHEEVTAALPSSARLVDAKREAPKELQWEPPKPKGDDAESSEAPANVTYKEMEILFKVRADYATWLQSLANLEKLGRFYRLKDVSIQSAEATSTETNPPLLINFKIGTYFGVTFPSKENSEG